MEGLLRSIAQDLLKGSLLDTAYKLLANPVLLKELSSLENNTELISFIKKSLPQLCEAYANGAAIEPSIMDSLSECGGILAPNVTNVIRNYKANSKIPDNLSTSNPYCPFYEFKGKFYLTCDEERNPIFNEWRITEINLWSYPLSQQKQDEYKFFAPMEKYIRKFWEGVSNTNVGPLYPPYHPVLICKLQYQEIVRWIAYDCGHEGIGLVAPGSSNANGSAPIEVLLKGHEHHAKLLRRYIEVQEDGELVENWEYGLTRIIYLKKIRVKLYDLLSFGVARAEPISLKWYLEKYKDDVITAVTDYVSNSCWIFVIECLYRCRMETSFDKLGKLYKIKELHH